MSIKLMSMIWSDHSKTLTSTEKSVLLRMADFAADDGSSIYPSIGRICDDTCLSKNTVKLCIKKLLDCGILKKVKNFSSMNYLANVYKINVAELERLNEISKFAKKIPPALRKAKLNTKKPVDNPQLEPVDKTPPGSVVDPGGGSVVGGGGGSATDPYPSLLTTIYEPVLEVGKGISVDNFSGEPNISHQIHVPTQKQLDAWERIKLEAMKDKEEAYKQHLKETNAIMDMYWKAEKKGKLKFVPARHSRLYAKWKRLNGKNTPEAK